MIIDIPDSEAGLLMYSLRHFAFKNESGNLKEKAEGLRQTIKEQIKNKEEIKCS